MNWFILVTYAKNGALSTEDDAQKGNNVSKAVAKKVPTPKPVVVSQVCDTCDEDWAEHPENPTVMDCLEILKAKKTLRTLVNFNQCCGHGHSCCHHWHYHYQQPYQVTYTTPVWISNNTTPTQTFDIISVTNTVQTPSLSNQLQLVS